jgi:protein tyrosine phosphatase (PTP) superfamily phosphohydrolase (DUF442 family)
MNFVSESPRGPRPQLSFARTLQRIGVVTAALALLAVLSAAGWLKINGVFGDNVHVVAPGKLYRSALMSSEGLESLIASAKIASVVSLRAADESEASFAAEIKLLHARGIELQKIPISAVKLPKPLRLEQLIERFDEGPYPMLVHCEEGADRTGLASVIWLVAYAGRSVEEARATELTWTKGHFAFGQAHAMDDFFDLYTKTARGQPLRDWILTTYPELYRRQLESHGAGGVVAAAGS